MPRQTAEQMLYKSMLTRMGLVEMPFGGLTSTQYADKEKMSNITVLPVVTSLDIPIERVLDGAAKANLKTCVVMGHDQDGELYFASSVADGGDVLWIMELAKKALMANGKHSDSQ